MTETSLNVVVQTVREYNKKQRSCEDLRLFLKNTEQHLVY